MRSLALVLNGKAGMNENSLQLWLRKKLPLGPIDAGKHMATWPRALMVLVSCIEDYVTAAAFLSKVARVEFGRLTLILYSEHMTTAKLDEILKPHGFGPFFRFVRDDVLSAQTYMSGGANKVESECSAGRIVEMRSTINGLLPTSILFFPEAAKMPCPSLVGKFDRAWLRMSESRLGLHTMHSLMRPNARMLVTTKGYVGERSTTCPVVDVEELSLKAHIVGQALVLPSDLSHSLDPQGSVDDSSHISTHPKYESRPNFSTTAKQEDNHVVVRDYMIQIPGDNVNMNFKVSCYCCQ